MRYSTHVHRLIGSKASMFNVSRVPYELSISLNQKFNVPHATSSAARIRSRYPDGLATTSHVRGGIRGINLASREIEITPSPLQVQSRDPL